MPFRPSFECLWCGRAWEARSLGDLEGWAALCPDCLGKADDNGFLRGRLRSALRERSSAAGAAGAADAADAAAPPASGDWEDWYLRRGSYSNGPLHDGPWAMELDVVTRWIDGLPISGVIVELGAGMGWWTALLAEKGELWLYDSDAASLDAARRRLLAHGLLAHLHQCDVLATPDKSVDVVFAAYLLSGARTESELDARIAAATAWLKSAGAFVLLEAGPGDSRPDAASRPLIEPTGPRWVQGPEGPLRARDPDLLRERLTAAGLTIDVVGTTARAFVFARATAA
jgi:SAM-dependent methyltransferase